MDFGEGKKPVALDPVIYEGGLKTGLNVGYYALVDVSGNLAACRRFYEKVFESVAFYYRDPEFFRMDRVNNHGLI